MYSKNSLSHDNMDFDTEKSDIDLSAVSGGALINITDTTDNSINHSYNNNKTVSFESKGNNNSQTFSGYINFSEKSSSKSGQTVVSPTFSSLLKFFED